MNLNETEYNQMLQEMDLLESIFDFWKNKKDPKGQSKDPNKEPIYDDLPDTQKKLDIDHFSSNEDIIKFMSFISNVNNIDKIKDKHQMIQTFRKYRELIDILIIALPYIKTKARKFGMVLPKIVESTELQNKIKQIFKN